MALISVEQQLDALTDAIARGDTLMASAIAHGLAQQRVAITLGRVPTSTGRRWLRRWWR